MISDNILLLIILILLIYLFEHRIIPLITVILISLMQLQTIFSDGIIESDVSISFGYSVLILYAGIMIATNTEEK